MKRATTKPATAKPTSTKTARPKTARPETETKPRTTRKATTKSERVPPQSSASTSDTHAQQNTSKPQSTPPNKKDKAVENLFASAQANMQFWQDLLGTVRQSLADAESQKQFQKKWAELIQELPKGFNQPDGRLNAPTWQADPLYAQVTQIYAYNAALLEKMIAALPLSDKESRRKVTFLGRQLIEAMSPANFAWTNPEFINKALQTGGESLTQGLQYLLQDVQKGRITHVDESQFEVGRNIACTEGKVVLQTPLYELIEYAPQTDKVSKRPLLFVPPCINKFYIMDLSPDNSLVKYAVEQGHHLYLISWRNIDAHTQSVEWAHYIGSVVSAINFVRDDNQGENCNVLGFCVGGTILSTTLAVMAAKNLQLPHSLTLLTTLLDFSEPGDLGVFLSEALLHELEAMVPQGGVVPGSALAQVFSTLRPRDLIWNYVTQKYLKGEKPKDFDILYWNGDATNQAVRMIAWYLRHCYWNNDLVKGQAVVLGEQLDLSTVNLPTYFYASREDHIVPWTSAFDSAQQWGNNPKHKRFVLGASGHIAGVINPAKANKRQYWLGANAQGLSKETNHQEWLASAHEKAGSWWHDWRAWLESHKGGEVTRASIGYEKKTAISPAPGDYVRVRAEQAPADTMLQPLKQWMAMFSSQ